MKNVKMGLLALVAIAGVGGAYANSHKNVKFNGTTYHAITDNAGGFSWTTGTIDTDNFSCASKPLAFCTIVTSGSPTPYVPTANQAPDPTKVSSNNGFRSFYISTN